MTMPAATMPVTTMNVSMTVNGEARSAEDRKSVV